MEQQDELRAAQAEFKALAGQPYRLVEHPWDALGEPPHPGGAYALLPWGREREEVDRLIKEADEYFDSASDKQRDAYEDEGAAEECLDEAIELVRVKVEPEDPGSAADLVRLIEARHRHLSLD